MATAQEIIRSALRKAQALSRGYTPQSEEMNEGLAELNQMIAAWETDSLTVPYRTRVNSALSTGQREFTIGPTAADITTTKRPIIIDAAFLRDTAGVDYPLDTQMTNVQEARIAVKTNQGRPDRLYYERGDPNGTIRFDYTIQYNDTLYADILLPLTGFSTLVSVDAVPEMYVEALIYNLAVRLAPDYGKEAIQTVKIIAVGSKRSIEADNLRFRVPTLGMDEALMRRRTHGRNINDGY